MKINFLLLLIVFASGCVTPEPNMVALNFVNKRLTNLEQGHTSSTNRVKLLERDIFRVVNILDVNTSIKLKSLKKEIIGIVENQSISSENKRMGIQRRIDDLAEELAIDKAKLKAAIIEENPTDYKKYLKLKEKFE